MPIYCRATTRAISPASNVRLILRIVERATLGTLPAAIEQTKAERIVPLTHAPGCRSRPTPSI